jgi:hypothetical protein
MDSATEDVSFHGEEVGGDDITEGTDVEQAPTDLHTTKVVRAQFESPGIPGDSSRRGGRASSAAESVRSVEGHRQRAASTVRMADWTRTSDTGRSG